MEEGSAEWKLELEEKEGEEEEKEDGRKEEKEGGEVKWKKWKENRKQSKKRKMKVKNHSMMDSWKKNCIKEEI